MPMMKANGANFYYELHGEGHPLILIAGYTCDHLFWIPLLGILSQFFQVLLFDNRGVGCTADDGRVLSGELLANDVMELASLLNLKQPHIIGQSMGGMIAQYIAALYPDRISKVGILSAPAQIRNVTLFSLKSLMMMREKNIDFDIAFAASFPWFYGKKFLQKESKIASIKKLVLARENPQSLVNQKRQLDLLATLDTHEHLTKIQAPTLIGYGKQDLMVLPSQVKSMARQIPQSTIIAFNCAHAIVEEVPNELSNTLLEFLQS
ncbi:MAG: alpha/beta hydrolase [Gammaproteobacteria bacterium]|nr:alpha/beta hydrolase [Gammaproteobacteria bacterium]